MVAIFFRAGVIKTMLPQTKPVIQIKKAYASARAILSGIETPSGPF
jgi:hypothetical protein